MSWLQNFLATLEGRAPSGPYAATGGPRRLMLPRLINTLINPFAVSGIQANFAKETYVFGNGSYIPLKGGLPTWVYVEFNTLGALKTGRSRVNLPDNFTLLAYFGYSSVNTIGGFRVNLYDVNRQMQLTTRPVNFQIASGTGSSPLFFGGSIGSRQAQPYQFQVDNAQAIVTVVNLEPNASVVQLGLYGLQNAQPVALPHLN